MATARARNPAAGYDPGMSSAEWREQQGDRDRERLGPTSRINSTGAFKGTPNRTPIKPGPGGKSGFNIRAVAEVLVEYGYDPTQSMVEILQGEPDPDAPESDPNRRIFRVDAKTRLQFANELLRYIHPQRKAVEVDQKVQLKGAELDTRLAQALGRFMSLGDQVPPILVAAAEETVAQAVREGLQAADFCIDDMI